MAFSLFRVEVVLTVSAHRLRRTLQTMLQLIGTLLALMVGVDIVPFETAEASFRRRASLAPVQHLCTGRTSPSTVVDIVLLGVAGSTVVLGRTMLTVPVKKPT